MMLQLVKFWRSRPPVPVLLICIFEFLGLLALPHAIFSEEAVSVGSWYQIYVGLTSLMTVAIIYFLWRMEKKGILIYIGAYLIHNVIALIASNWMIGVLIIPIVGIILISFCLERFNRKTSDNNQIQPTPSAPAD